MIFENTIDIYAHSNNLKDVNPYFKVFIGISTMIVSLVSASPILPLIITAFMSFLIIFKAKVSWKFYLKYLLIPFSFGFLTFLFMALFFGVGANIWELGIFNIAVTEDGFNLGFLVFARMLGGFSCLAFLALTTPMNELFSVLEHFKIPKIVLELAMLMYRYIFVFLDEAIHMYHSQETRLGYSTLKGSFKSMGMLVSNLFITTWFKGEKTYVSMEARCYDGSIRTLKAKNSMSTQNILFLFFFECFLLVGTYLTWGFKVI